MLNVATEDHVTTDDPVSTISASAEADSLYKVTIATATDKSETCKRYSVKDGSLVRAHAMSPNKSSYYEAEFNTLGELSSLIDSLDHNDYLGSGLAHAKGDPSKRISEGTIIGKDALTREIEKGTAGTKKVSRTKDCMIPGHIALIDLDGIPGKFEDVIPMVRSIHPALENAPLLARASSSHGVHVKGEVPDSKINAHVYLLIEAGIDNDTLSAFGKLLGKQCWLQDLNPNIQISTSGKMNVRQMIDVTVFSAERPIFEAKPRLGKGVSQIERPPAIIDEGNGKPLDVAAVVAAGLTVAEEAEYNRLVTEAKRLAKPEADRVSKRDTESKVKNIVAMGVPEGKARRDVAASKRDGSLYGAFQLKHIRHGLVTVDEVLDDMERFEGAGFTDPLEHDYHDGADVAKLYMNLDTATGEFNPIMYSQAHGGRSYKLKREPIKSPTSVRIRAKLSSLLGLDNETIQQHNIVFDSAVEATLNGAIYNPSTSKISMLNDEGDFITNNVEDSRTSIPRSFGTLSDSVQLNEIIDGYIENLKTTPSEDKANRFRANVLNVAVSAVIEELKYSNQRKQIEYIVDMFAEKAHIKLTHDKAQVTLTPQPIKFRAVKATDDVKAEIVKDYIEHFPLLQDFLEFIVAARFAPDRKNAFLWLHCVSDWGKNYLVDVFKYLGLVVELSPKELEKMIDGAPVGRSATEFVHAYMLVFDEVKSVKGEVKQINNKVNSAAKYEMSSSIEVYAKLFLSAETIPSLAGEQGAEQQFSRRFNKFEQSGALNERDVFIKHGAGLHHDVVTEYVAGVMSGLVESYIAKGRELAIKTANDHLIAFHEVHGLGNFVHSLDDVVAEYAQEVGDLIRAFAKYQQGTHFHPFEFNGCDDRTVELLRTLLVIDDYEVDRFVLKSPTTFVAKYLDVRVSHSAKGSLTYKHQQIVEQMGVSDRHYITRDGVKRRERGCLVTPF